MATRSYDLAWCGGSVVLKLVLDALGSTLKGRGWFLRYVVRGVLGGCNFVAGVTSAFQMSVVLGGLAPKIAAGVSAGAAVAWWLVLHVVGRKLFFAPALPPAVRVQQAELMSKAKRWEALDRERRAKEAAAKEAAANEAAANEAAALRAATEQAEKDAEEPNQEVPLENGTAAGESTESATEPTVEDGAALIELVFGLIDADKSGELSSEEFSNWWLASGGDADRLKTVAQAFDIISKRDGKPGCSPAEFKQLIVASIQEDWEEKFDENLKPYYTHVKTGESSLEDANERHAAQFFRDSGITSFTAAQQ